jgi:hypothetical protein
VDYDGDGTQDFVSGSYDPGDVYLFRGLGKGAYAPATSILDETGTPLVHHPEELKKYEQMKQDPSADKDVSIHARVASFGSWASPVDWDGDGDLDMLIGSFAGNLYRRMNVGTRREPRFAAESLRVEADGKSLQVSGHCDPVAADWDGDGAWDLVVGASDGSVSWYRNLGSPTEPRFGPRQILVEKKADSKFLTQYIEPGQAPSPGVRAQICVTDYDLDGKLDLLLGDYSSLDLLRELDESERAEFQALLQTEAKLLAREVSESDAAAQEQLESELQKIADAKHAFLQSSASKERRPPASYIWLYRRLATPGKDADGGR